MPWGYTGLSPPPQYAPVKEIVAVLQDKEVIYKKSIKHFLRRKSFWIRRSTNYKLHSFRKMSRGNKHNFPK